MICASWSLGNSGHGVGSSKKVQQDKRLCLEFSMLGEEQIFPSTSRESQRNELLGHEYGSPRKKLAGIILKYILPKRTTWRHTGTNAQLEGWKLSL